MLRRLPIAVLAVLAWLAPVTAQAQRARIAPEAASGFSGRELAVAKDYMVSAANPLAVRAGVDILAKGGSAIDAAIAVQLVLNIVEPQSSGIGGGAFLVRFDGATGAITTYDGRETAPAAATPDRFLKDGKALPFDTAVHSGLSVGVPGVVALMKAVHDRHGKLPWKALFEPAIKLATDGFEVSPRLNILLVLMGADQFTPAARRHFFDDSGTAYPAGHRLTNLAFAATLRRIADEGPTAFYTGETARAIVAAVKDAPNAPGDLTVDDLAGYTVVERPPVCVGYRSHQVCGMGPPSSGGITVGQTLALLEPYGLGSGPESAMAAGALHLIAEAEKLAYADRNRFIGDPDQVAVPPSLLDRNYLAARAALIDRRRAASKVSPGVPPGVQQQAFGADATVEAVGTSHISIVDANGNAVAMTTTIEAAFGSRVWAAGFLLNNQLTDFSFRPVDGSGRPVANAVAPGKRPRSSMAPTIVLGPDGRLFAVTGSPGGSRIILYVVKSLVALIDWKLDAQAATELLNFGSRGQGFEIEIEPGIASGSIARLWRAKPSIWHAIRLKPFGHEIRPDLMTSGLHIVARRGDVLTGGADPRREGLALGN